MLLSAHHNAAKKLKGTMEANIYPKSAIYGAFTLDSIKLVHKQLIKREASTKILTFGPEIVKKVCHLIGAHV